MARTKRRFIGEGPPTPSGEQDQYNQQGYGTTQNDIVHHQNNTVVYPRTSFGGGKQFRPAGGGKQMRVMDEDDSDEEDSADEIETEQHQPQTQTITYSGRPGGGKTFRPMGGKQLFRRDESEDEEEEEESGSGSDDDESDVEPPEVAAPVPAPAPAPQVYHPVSRGGGKSIAHMQRSRGGKMLRPPSEDEESSSSSEEDEEPIAPLRVTHAAGGGKMLRRPVQHDSSEEEPEDDDGDDDDDNDDDYKEEEEEVAKEDEKEASEDMEIDNDSDESDYEEKPAPAAVAKPPAAKSKVDEVEDEDEDEDDDMEESSEESSSEEEFSEDDRELDMETLNEKELIEDEADQKYLDSLPEIERESILAGRFEKLKAAADMKRALKEDKRRKREKKRLAGGKKKTKSTKAKKSTKKPAEKEQSKKDDADVDMEDTSVNDVPDTSKDAELAAELALKRASTNRDATGVKAKKQAALERLRKDRGDTSANRKVEKGDGSESEDYGDDSDDDSDEDYGDEGKTNRPWLAKKVKTATRLSSYGDSDEESDDDERRGKNQRTFVEADLIDFIKVTIPRRRLARWCNEPFFSKAVMNFYVRLAIGRDKATQRPCYRLCKVVGIETGKQYQIPPLPNNPNGKPVTTNKMLNLKFAESTKLFKMVTISDSKPTEDDVKQCLTQMKNRRGGARNVLSKKDANKMRKAQDDLVNNYTYTAEDIQKSIQERKTLSNRVNNIGAEKTKASIAVSAARSVLDDARKELKDLEAKLLEADGMEEEAAEDEVNEAKRKVAELEEDLKQKQLQQKKIIEAEESRLKRIRNSKKVQDWARVNERAKAANKAADTEAYKSELARRENKDSGPKDLYARRKVKPTILWEVGQKEEKTEEASKKDKDPESDAANNNEGTHDDSNATNGKDESRKLANDKAKIAEQMGDMAIEEVALATGLPGTNGKKISATRVRKGISLDEYFERKAVGAI